MRKMIFLVLLAALLSGCSMIGAYRNNATPEEWKNATCQDAGLAYALSASQLVGMALGEETKLYWELYKAGAGTFLSVYCSGKVQ